MERFLQVTAGVLLTVVLGIALGKGSKDITLVLSMVVCCMVLTAAFAYLEPVIDFLKELQTLGQLDSTLSGVVLKAVGIGLIAEIAILICSDSGNAALGKALQIMGTAVILWLSIPVFTGLFELIRQIMGEI